MRASVPATAPSSSPRWGSPSPSTPSSPRWMPMSGSDRLLALALGLVTAAGCTHPPDVPETPDVSHLLSAYSAPGGTVDPAHPAAWLDAAVAQVELLGGGQ